MVLVAVLGLLSWLARSEEGRLCTILSAVVLAGLVVTGYLSAGIDRLADLLVARFRRTPRG